MPTDQLCLAPQTGTDKAFASKTTTRFVRYNLQQLMNDHQTAATKIAKMETRLEAALASGFNYKYIPRDGTRKNGSWLIIRAGQVFSPVLGCVFAVKPTLRLRPLHLQNAMCTIDSKSSAARRGAVHRAVPQVEQAMQSWSITVRISSYTAQYATRFSSCAAINSDSKSILFGDRRDVRSWCAACMFTLSVLVCLNFFSVLRIIQYLSG